MTRAFTSESCVYAMLYSITPDAKGSDAIQINMVTERRNVGGHCSLFLKSNAASLFR